MVSAVGKDLTKHVYDLLPAVASELFTTKVMLPTMNIVVSNVRGPDLPIYLAGAQLVAFAPISIPLDGLGLNITGFSYHGTMWVCAVACREMIPDPGVFADCMREAFAELVAAADARAAAPRAAGGTPAGKPSRKPKARAKVSRRKASGRKGASASKQRPGRKPAAAATTARAQRRRE